MNSETVMRAAWAMEQLENCEATFNDRVRLRTCYLLLITEGSPTCRERWGVGTFNYVTRSLRAAGVKWEEPLE
jgi:hypothetical protein